MTKHSPLHRRIQHYAETCSAVDFFNLLTAPGLLDYLDAHLPAHRERLFPPTETLSMFLAQALSADSSCRLAVDQATTYRVLAGLPCCSTATGGYCRARARLPQTLVAQLTRFVSDLIAPRLPRAWHWHGRRVRIADGTTLALADTPANQTAYPQPRTQKPGLGFPLCRVVALFNLADGTVADAAIGGYRGKNADERTLLRQLLDRFAPNDILLGDALFCTYFLLAELQARGVDAIFEQNGRRRRSTDFRRGRRLGHYDHLITLQKPKQKPHWMSAADYAQAPDELTVRELKAGGKLLVTTLTDTKAWPKHSLKTGYRQRWDAEINLRHLKTTLGMEVLRGRSPAMCEKELWVYFLAYNLIRWLMVDSAKVADVLPRQLSFKHALAVWTSAQARWAPGEADARIDQLLGLIAQPRVANRPGRLEPRAVKRRPKQYARLSVPRANARASIHRYGHPNRQAGESLKYLNAGI